MAGAHAATGSEMSAAQEALHAAVDARFAALKKCADELLASQTSALRAQSNAIELHVDGVVHAMEFAADVAAHGSDSEVGVTHVAMLALLAAATEEHAAIIWTPTCEGPASLQLVAPDALAAWLDEHCTLV
jgi:hypothetical protein